MSAYFCSIETCVYVCARKCYEISNLTRHANHYERFTYRPHPSLDTRHNTHTHTHWPMECAHISSRHEHKCTHIRNIQSQTVHRQLLQSNEKTQKFLHSFLFGIKQNGFYFHSILICVWNVCERRITIK